MNSHKDGERSDDDSVMSESDESISDQEGEEAEVLNLQVNQPKKSAKVVLNFQNESSNPFNQMQP
jgi:hypothetical protein